MNSKKLWASFALIFIYLLLAALVASGSASLLLRIAWKWGVPFAFGCVFWVGSLVFFLYREKAFLFSPLSLASNAVGAGLLIGSYLVGKKIAVAWTVFAALSALIAATYLLLMLLLSVPVLKRKIWYVIVVFVLSVTASILLSVYLFPVLLTGAGMDLPKKLGLILAFFLLLYGALALGSVAPVEDFEELLTILIAPALIATFLLAIIVLLCLAGGDGCDCGDGCDSCCDCGDCSGGEYNSTSFGKRRKSTSMSQISNLPNPNL